MIFLSDIKAVSWNLGEEELVVELKDETTVRVRDFTDDPDYCKIVEHVYLAGEDAQYLVQKFIETIQNLIEELALLR